MITKNFVYEHELAIKNFGQGQTPRRVVRAYALVKQAAFRASYETLARNQTELFRVVDGVWRDMALGRFDDRMKLGLEQGGAGTSLHFLCLEIAWMEIQRQAQLKGFSISQNMLELLNKHQSTNDTLPTAMTVDLLWYLRDLEQAVIELQEVLVAREQKDRNVLHVGRTEGKDALPMRWGQYWSAWAGVLERDRWRLARFQERVRVVPLGGTAIGTCLGATLQYRNSAIKYLRELTGLPLSQSQNPCADLAHQDVWSECAGLIETLSGSLVRLARELLDMVSEPDGILKHPQLQTGSTQMPAKSNPVMLEYFLGMALEALGEAAKVHRLVQEGRGQINALVPFLWQALGHMAEAILKALRSASTIIPKLELDTELSEKRLRESAALLNALAIFIGYNEVKNIWEKLSQEDRNSWDSLLSALVELGDKSHEEWKSLLDPLRLTTPRGER
jgi:aspartate ammonia-lyase